MRGGARGCVGGGGASPERTRHRVFDRPHPDRLGGGGRGPGIVERVAERLEAGAGIMARPRGTAAKQEEGEEGGQAARHGHHAIRTNAAGKRWAGGGERSAARGLVAP